MSLQTAINPMEEAMLVVRAPLRISFGGGGTDLAAYYEQHGGFVLSTSITRYAYVVVRRPPEGGYHLNSADYRISQSFRHGLPPVREPLSLPKAVLEWFGRRGKLPHGVELFLAAEVAPGSGLGSSSAVTVALLQALAAYMGEQYAPAELAELAAWIEIERLGMPIGKQDQYAAAVGGLNTISFTRQGVEVTPLPLSDHVRRSLAMRLMLFATGKSRHSSEILQGQVRSLSQEQEKNGDNDRHVTQRLHHIKSLAEQMREALKMGDLDSFGALLHESWRDKRQLSPHVTTPEINRAYEAARQAGALGGKLCGAGGGGYLMLYCPPRCQREVRSRMGALGLQELSFGFDRAGASVLGQARPGPQTWRAAAIKEKKKPMSGDLEQYWQELGDMARRMPLDDMQRAVDLLVECQKNGGAVFAAGNGGSAATASHFVCDLAKGTRSNGAPTFRAIALNDNVPLLTAWGNDTSYEQVFAEQLASLVREGDVLVAISTSGNSPNILAAAEMARARRARVIALTGAGANALERIADLTIATPAGAIEQVEDLHMSITHSLCVALRNQMAVSNGARRPAPDVRQQSRALQAAGSGSQS